VWLYDVFISHASEDKDDLVRPLAEALKALHVEVWYDEFALKLGDSLRRSIDKGLARSRYAVVVLSPAFFQKNWPQRELDGLVAREMDSNDRVILPVWHRVSRKDVIEFSPPLADVLAIDSAHGVGHLAAKIAEVAKPRGSPLITARDKLIERGVTPPVVTDEWWLDVVEASNREYPWGYVMHREHWGRWSFWLPGDDGDPDARGERLAFTAMQMAWTAEAASRPITQITRPADVLAFIASQTGLADTCHEQPKFLAMYAPQLTIPGFGGEFEEGFENILVESMAEREEQIARGSPSGTGLTHDGSVPGCDSLIMFRHPQLGNYDPSMITCQFVQGETAGPPVKHYPTFEYLIWALSDASTWLPDFIRKQLVLGFVEWPTWLWNADPAPSDSEHGLRLYTGREDFLDALYAAKESKAPFVANDVARSDLIERCEDSRRVLGLVESAEELARRFLEGPFVEGFLKSDEIRRKRKRTKAEGRGT